MKPSEFSSASTVYFAELVAQVRGYVADGYRVSHSDQPRKEMEGAEAGDGEAREN